MQNQNKALPLHHQNKQTMKTIEIVKAKLNERTTEQLMQDAKVAHSNMSEEANRMICAVACDLIIERIGEVEGEKFMTEIYGE